MGNICCNNQITDNDPDSVPKAFNQIKKYNEPEAKSNDCKEILINGELIRFESSNFNLYDSIVKKMNFDENATSKEQAGKITFTTVDKKGNKVEYKFLRLSVLGEGSFGVVLLVRQTDTLKVFAMKILDKSFLASKNQKTHTINERKILENIQSPFIVKLEFAFQSKKKLYMIMEFAQGGELSYHLENEFFFSLDRARFYISEVVLAIEAVHKHNSIYRDLKPENILIDKDGHIKLTDFGLCVSYLKDDRAYSFCGTPGYFAPDILLEGGYDKRSDFFSIGILLYQMIEGKLPYESLQNFPPNRNNYEAMEKVLNEELCFSNKFTDTAIDLCKALLDKNPDKRPQSITEIKRHPFFIDSIYCKQLDLF